VIIIQSHNHYDVMLTGTFGQKLTEVVDKMLAVGIVEPAASPWSSNIVAVPKADGSIRVMIDYRLHNEVTY